MSNPKSNPDPPPPAPAEASPSEEIDFELSLEDTLSQQRRVLATRGRKGGPTGYDPYDMPLTPPAAAEEAKPGDGKRKPTDLRKLSEWIRLQRQVQALKKDEPESD